MILNLTQRQLGYPNTLQPTAFFIFSRPSDMTDDDEARVSVVPPVVASFFRLLAGG